MSSGPIKNVASGCFSGGEKGNMDTMPWGDFMGSEVNLSEGAAAAAWWHMAIQARRYQSFSFFPLLEKDRTRILGV